MKYVIEPLLFSFENDISKEDLERYLIILQDFDDWWSSHKEQVYTLSDTDAILFANGYYPYEESLLPLLEKYGINYVSYKEIRIILDKYLNKSKKIDIICKENRSVIIEEKSRIIKKVIKFTCNRPPVLHEELNKLLWYVFYYKLIHNDEIDSYVIFVKGIIDNINLTFEYNLLTDEGEIVSLKDDVIFNCKSSLVSFIEDKNTPFLLWRVCEDKSDLELGIRIKICQDKRLSKISDTYICDFLIQDSFYKDYCDGHYKNQKSNIRSTINAIYYAITDGKLNLMHSIREGGPGGGNKDLIVNGYAAKRRNITTSIKLAYWKKDNRYMIANMKEHDLVDISEEFE